MKNNIKKIVLVVLFCFVISFFTLPAFSKYRSNTSSRIINLFTRYNINYVTAGGRILNLEDFSSYVSVLGLTLPTEDDVDRIGYDFNGWYANNGFTGSPITSISSGETGEKTFYASWIVSRYTLTVNVSYGGNNIEAGLPEGWDLVIGKDLQGNDNVITLDSNGQVIVDKGQTVSLRTRYSQDASLAGWTINENIVFSERYTAGDQYIYYDFRMPRHTVTATYGEEKDGCIDISKSPITFEENVNVGSRTQNGFWYQSTIRGMSPLKTDNDKGYFYAWDNSETFCVTSNGVATKNQLTIVGAMKVNLKNVNLIETDTFSSNASGNRFGESDIISGNAVGNTSPYANIIYDYTDHTSYTSYLYFIGTGNKVNAILSKTFNWANDYGSTIYLYGETSNSAENSVELGTIIGNYSIYFYNLTIDEYDNDFTLLAFSNRSPTGGAIQFSNCILNAPSKFIVAKGQSLYYVNSNIDIRTIYAYSTLSLSGTSYVRVRENVISGYGTVSISGSASIVVDGNISPTYSHATSVTTINTNGFVIIKGHLFEATNLTFTKGTLIANEVVIGRTFNLRGGTIVTNQIIQAPGKYPAYSKTSGTYVYTTTPSSSYNTLVTANDDNLPFATYSQSSTNEGVYSITGTNIYLLGYYQITTSDGNNWLDTSVDLSTSENKLRYLVYGKENTNLPVLLDENGDLVTNPSIASVDLEDFVDDYGTPLTETIIIGNSTYVAGQSRGRSVSISGGKIYSAGNITFFNDTTITGGTITTAGTFSTKRDLNISNNATINSSIIGNKKAIVITENGLKRYTKTNISGGIITTNMIGAIDAGSYSNVSISSSTINSLSSNNIDIQSDTYINYFADSSIFNADTSDTTLRFNGSIASGSNKTLDDANMQLANQKTFTLPTIISDSSNGLWVYNSINGNVVNYVDIYGQVNGTSTYGNLYNVDKISLYAVKGSYNLIVKEGLNYISSASENGSSIDLSSSSTSVVPNGTILLNINDSSMLNKIIIWYIDGNGIVHNTNPTIDVSNLTVTFTMPYADTEIYITNTMILYLNKYPITLTNVGFNTEFGEESSGTYTFTSDSVFNYSGNYMISHSDITRVNVSSSVRNTATPLTSTPSSKSTSNKVHILDNFDNTSAGSQTVTITKLIQSASTGDSYFKLEDGAKADILVDGAVQIYLVEVPFNSDIIFKGVHGDRSDSLYVATAGSSSNLAAIGSSTGQAGNITLQDLKIITRSSANGTIGYSYSKTNKTLSFINCLLERDQWYSSSGIARYFTNVIIDNSDFTINQSTSWPGSVFVSTNNVRVINGSTINYTYGASSTYAVPLFYTGSTLTTTLEIVDSNINMTSRKSTSSTLYQERHANTHLFTNVILSGTSQITANQKLNLRNLTLNDNSQITVDSGNGYLFAPNITLNGGTINAGYLLVSGYYYPTTTDGASESKTRDNLIAALNAGTLVLNGSSYNGLVVNGGTINASEFIGGDKNAKVTINGGIVNAKNIGTSGKLYGYITAMAKTNEEYVHSLDKIPASGTTVTVSGGTVNVLANGYLGGMNATVNVTGGTINLASGAIIGVNRTQKTTLYNDATSHGNTPSNFVNITISGGEVTGNNGKISAPYSTLAISGASTGINTSEIVAEVGTINIQAANSKYTCPLDSSKNVGIIATTKITGLNVNITNGASVYGGRITSSTLNTTDSGILTVDSTSSIYSNSYGSEGSGTSTVTINGTAVGSRQYNILYVMNDNYQDRATNSNPEYYISGSGLQLSNPTRFGFTFSGWYLNNNLITEVSSSQTGDIEIEARWIPNQVAFKVTIKASDVGLSASEFASEVSGLNGVLDGNKFTFNGTVLIDYRDLLIGTNNIDYSNYNLPNHLILSAKINNNTLNPDNDEINVVSSTVTQEIMEYYLNNNEPIEIAIVSIS